MSTNLKLIKLGKESSCLFSIAAGGSRSFIAISHRGLRGYGRPMNTTSRWRLHLAYTTCLKILYSQRHLKLSTRKCDRIVEVQERMLFLDDRRSDQVLALFINPTCESFVR